MRKTYILPFVALSTMLAISCASDTEAESALQPAPAANSAIAPVAAPAASAASSAIAMNPAHGLPGHRCEIAVGAPLNSAPAAPSTPVSNVPPGQSFPLMSRTGAPINNAANTVQATTIPPANAIPASNTVANGLNPAHGQPGHRCDISVGAPLNSPPGKTTPTTTSNTPVPVPNFPATNAEGQKLNPPHGQPGHDCAVEVGKPLKGQ